MWDAPPGTFTAEWQCEMYCHSHLNVPNALPLAPDRAVSVRSMPSGSVGCAARYVHRRVAVWDALPLAPGRTGRTATRPWAYQYGTLDAEWQWGLHCHSHLNVPSHTFTAEWQ